MESSNLPAIVWSTQSCDKAVSSYWDLSFLDGDEPSISYNELHRLIAILSYKIKGLISKAFQNEPLSAGSGLLQVPVAVAVPEGPLLPVSIAAVHALNVPFEIKSRERDMSVVLMPLDPCDGFERVRNMLEDARPLLVLAASESDQQRLQKIVDKMAPPIKTHLDSSLYQAPTTRLVDVRELIGFQDNVVVDSRATLPTDGPDGRVRLSHLVFTSGTTGRPKGCLSSFASLQSYIRSKNHAHGITSASVVFLASSISFDPCLSDVLATFEAGATLAIARRSDLIQNLGITIQNLAVSHILCTPSLWSAVERNQYDFRHLRVIALGGEKIPIRIVQNWARLSTAELQEDELTPRLCSTFGVTESCVYQTFGEIFRDDKAPGQNVGRPFRGMQFRICRETYQQDLVDVSGTGYPDGVGEVVLTGDQLDALSSYLHHPEVAASKFVQRASEFLYRTGDKGYVEPETGRLFLFGRIEGEDGMVKFNGIRVELGEIENALIDLSREHAVITDSIVVANSTRETSTTSEILAYVVLSAKALTELGVSTPVKRSGLMCNDVSLLSLLQERCKAKARVVPSMFIAIPRIPVTPTGKRNRRGVPAVRSATPMLSTNSTPLKDYGHAGKLLADEITECLNLAPEHATLMVASATFAMLGGDSLSATRIVRALYAKHHEIFNSRHLGGQFGTLEGPFNVVHFLKAETLGSYVDWLDKHGICSRSWNDDRAHRIGSQLTSPETLQTDDSRLYEALLKAIVFEYTCIALAILELGVDPNKMMCNGRIGKTSGRIERRQLFRSSPLHLACLQGTPILVKGLLERNARYNAPDASGLFPIHSAVLGPSSKNMGLEEQSKRLECVKFLLKAGVPLTILDGSKQTIAIAAARAGNVTVLEYILEIDRAGIVGWRDTWSRTAVHWAVLNGHVSALEVLLKRKGLPDPKPIKQTQKRSSVAHERPLEICQRVHGNSELGARIRKLLENAMERTIS